MLKLVKLEEKYREQLFEMMMNGVIQEKKLFHMLLEKQIIIISIYIKKV